MPLGFEQQNQVESVATDGSAIPKRRSQHTKLARNPIDPATDSPLISPAVLG